MPIFSLPPGAAQGITQGWDQYTQRQERNQLMDWRRREMEADAMRRQQEREALNRKLESERGGGRLLETAVGLGMPPPQGQPQGMPQGMPPGGAQPFPMDQGVQSQAMAPAPGQASVAMNPPRPPGQSSADYPNFNPAMVNPNMQAGVQPYPGPGPGDMGIVAGQPSTNEPLRRPPGYFEDRQFAGSNAVMGDVAAAPQPQVQPHIPPYKEINREGPTQEQQLQQQQQGNQFMAPPPPQRQPVEAAPAGGGVSMESLYAALKKDKVPGNMWLPYLNSVKGVMDMQAKEELNNINAQYRAAQAQNFQQTQETMGKYRDAQIENLGKTQELNQSKLDLAKTKEQNMNENRIAKLAYEEMRALAAQKNSEAYQRNSERAKLPSAGNLNSALSLQLKDFKPVDDAQLESEQIRGLISSADPASKAQVQRALANYLNHGRSTNALYVDNAGFGNVYERGSNLLSRWGTGDYSDKNKQEILDMINTMDKAVFDPARVKLNAKWKKMATSAGYDAENFGRENVFRNDAAPAKPSTTGKPKTEQLRDWAKSTDMGAGWTVKERK